jgi:hypothetical protein
MTREEIMQKWIAALRSGEYQQGVELLAYKHDGGTSYCCLGVLCDVINYPKKEWFENTAELPRLVTEKVGIQECGQFDEDNKQCLALMNDQGMSFAEIADWLEKPENQAKLYEYYRTQS